jgi:hypothetical protein
LDTRPRGADWRSILLIIFGLSGTLLTISSAIGIFVFIAVNENFLAQMNTPVLASILTASTLIAIGLLLLPVTWLSIKRLRGWNFDSFSLPPLRPWTWIVIPILWLLVLALATLYHNVPGANWYLPVLHFLSIALPIYLVIRIATNRIPFGSSQRAWTVFGTGMTLSPIIAVLAEIIVLALGVLVIAVYLGFNPETMAEVERLISQIDQAPDMDSMVYTLEPLLKNPLTLLAALTLLSFLVPIIEESAKSLGIWLVSDRLASPAQGFALGVLSGAGFALAESLSASLTVDDTWGITLFIRAISGSMHMLATGLVGWGIAYARLEKRYFRMISMTLLAIFLHAAWNAGAVFTIAGGARAMFAMPDFDFVGAFLAFSGMGLLFVLTSGMVIAFFVINPRLRTPSLPPPLPVEMGEESRIPQTGEDNEGPVG